MEPSFACTTTALADGHLITVAGEIDLETTPKLAEAVAQCADGPVRVDIGAVTFLDSCGIWMLLVAHNEMRRNGRRMIICGPLDQQVRQVFEITQAYELLEFDDPWPQWTSPVAEESRNMPNGPGALQPV